MPVRLLLEHRLIGDLRGLGYLYTLELVSDKIAKTWDLPVEPQEFAATLLRELRDRRLLCRVTVDADAPVLLQIAPPLITTRDEIDNMIVIARNGLDATLAHFMSS